jgi:hypothetical protein
MTFVEDKFQKLLRERQAERERRSQYGARKRPRHWASGTQAMTSNLRRRCMVTR